MTRLNTGSAFPTPGSIARANTQQKRRRQPVRSFMSNLSSYLGGLAGGYGAPAATISGIQSPMMGQVQIGPLEQQLATIASSRSMAPDLMTAGRMASIPGLFTQTTPPAAPIAPGGVMTPSVTAPPPFTVNQQMQDRVVLGGIGQPRSTTGSTLTPEERQQAWNMANAGELSPSAQHLLGIGPAPKALSLDTEAKAQYIRDQAEYASRAANLGVTPEMMTRRGAIAAQAKGYGIDLPFGSTPVAAEAQYMQQVDRPDFAGPMLSEANRTRKYNEAIAAGTPNYLEPNMTGAQQINELRGSPASTQTRMRMVENDPEMRRAMWDQLAAGYGQEPQPMPTPEELAARRQQKLNDLGFRQNVTFDEKVPVGRAIPGVAGRLPPVMNPNDPLADQAYVTGRTVDLRRNVPPPTPENIAKYGDVVTGPRTGTMFHQYGNDKYAVPRARTTYDRNMTQAQKDLLRQRRAERDALVASRRPQTLGALNRQVAANIANKMMTDPESVSDAEMLFAFGQPGGELLAAQDTADAARQQAQYGMWGNIAQAFGPMLPTLWGALPEDTQQNLLGLGTDYIQGLFPPGLVSARNAMDAARQQADRRRREEVKRKFRYGPPLDLGAF